MLENIIKENMDWTRKKSTDTDNGYTYQPLRILQSKPAYYILPFACLHSIGICLLIFSGDWQFIQAWALQTPDWKDASLAEQPVVWAADFSCKHMAALS